MIKWQPIETAPRDSRSLLLAEVLPNTGMCVYVVAHWNLYSDCWECDTSGYRYTNPRSSWSWWADLDPPDA